MPNSSSDDKERSGPEQFHLSGPGLLLTHDQPLGHQSDGFSLTSAPVGQI